MKIRSMTASFGKLDHARLDLKDGLNIIYAPNEAGKSTWCAFIRAMLYGVPTRDRDKKGYLAEKNRYQPWSGAPMEGEMVLEWQGREIVLRRFSKGVTPFGGFSAVYADSQQPVPELDAQNCGQMLLGVGREVWERSAFLGSAPTLAIDGTPELERRIAALFSSGEEDVSFSQAEARLREWLRRRQHNKTGLIPKLEEELTRVNATLDQMRQADLRLVQAQEQRPGLQSQLQELEHELHIHQRLAQRDLNRRYGQAMQELEQVRTELDGLQSQQARLGPLPHRDLLRDSLGRLQRSSLLEEELERSRQELQQTTQKAQSILADAADPRFDALDGRQATTRAHQDRTLVETLQGKVSRCRALRSLLLLPGLLLGGGLAAAGLLLSAHSLWFVLGGLVLCALSALISISLCGRAIQKARQQAEQLLARYRAGAPEEITAAAEDYLRRQEEAARARDAVQRLEDSVSRQQDRLAVEQRDVLQFVLTFAPDVSSPAGCSAALTTALNLEDRVRECLARLELATRRCDDLRAQGAQEADTLELLHTPERSADQLRAVLARTHSALSSLDQQEAMAKGELLTLGDRAQLEAHREGLQAQLERRRREYEALSLALDRLRQANASLQERFAPELNRRAGEIMSQLTGGRYEAVTLDRAFDAAARSTDSLLPRSALALSRGTADQLYLAVRLAVCQLCLPEPAPSPLILDDALLTFDDERMALVLNYLSRTGQQVILFSCQQRENRLGLGTTLSLQSE